MSHATLLTITSGKLPPTVPTSFVTNSGTAVPAANSLNTLGAVVAAGSNPFRSIGSGSTVTYQVQISQAIGVTDATKIGLSSFNSTQFTVDANGFVSLSGSASLLTLTGNSGGAISPVAGNINTIGAGSITTTGAGNTLTTQLTGLVNHSVQVGAGTATLTQLAVGTNGQLLIAASGSDPAFAALTSSDGSVTFTPGANSLSLQVTGGATVFKTITGNSGGALPPSGGNFNFLTANTTITFAGAGSTETLDFGGLSLVLGSSASSMSGNYNVGLGQHVLDNVTTGFDNTAIGAYSLNANIIGTDCTCVGASAGRNSTASWNTAVGSNALFTETTGNANVAMGFDACNGQNTATGNTGVGYYALKVATSGGNNTALGSNAGLGIVAGANNTILGASACFNQNTSNSTAVGYQAIGDSSGSNNTAFGYQALSSAGLITGGYNLALGYQAGNVYTGTEASNITIQNNGTIGDNNTTRIGTQGAGNGQQNKCFVAGIVGVTVSNAQVVTINSSTGQLGVSTSGGFTWNNVTAASASMVTENGYQSNNAGVVTLTLPATGSSTFGDTIMIMGLGAGGWSIAQLAGQQIIVGSSSSTVGVGGSVASTNRYDCIELVYSSTSGLWRAVNFVGNLTVT